MDNYTILLIEDDESVASYIKYRLEKKDYNVHHVNNGIEGLEQIEELKPSLVILDMIMPGIDGREVTELVIEEEIFDPARIIVLSGKEKTDEVKALFDLGIHDYLQKPFNIDNLVLRIERALANVNESS